MSDIRTFWNHECTVLVRNLNSGGGETHMKNAAKIQHWGWPSMGKIPDFKRIISPNYRECPVEEELENMAVVFIVVGLVRVKLNWGGEVCDYIVEGKGM
jgi:hypothetical protein